MVFLGTTFCSGRNSLFPPATPSRVIMTIQISDGVYNHLFLSANPDLTFENINDDWDSDTKINASFDDNLEGGGSGFAVRNTDNLVIRRREFGTTKWITLYVKPIRTKEDFDVHYIDKYARAGVEYEYSVSSYLNDIENSYVVKNIFSDFDGYYITDKDCLYGTIYDLDGCDTSRNMSAQALELLNSKYMHVVSNSSLNCDSGSITGSFIKMNDSCTDINLSSSLLYRNEFKDRLANHKPLILKIHDGRIWIIRVTGGIKDSKKGHVDLRQITFEWVEVGDINDMETLYGYGFIDTETKWW